FASGIFFRSAAGRNLTGKQRRRNRAMKYSGTSANHQIPFRTCIESESDTWIEVVVVIIQRFFRPGLKFVSKAKRCRKPASDSHVVLHKGAVVRVIKNTFRLVAYSVGDSAVEVRRGGQSWLIEVRCPESLEKDYKRIAVQQIRQRSEGRLKWIEQRKRF